MSAKTALFKVGMSWLGAHFLRRTENMFGLCGVFVTSSWSLARQILSLKLRFKECLEQTYAIAVQSLPVIAFALSFVGLMLILEFSFHMKLVLRQDSLVPAFSTLLMIRELGPVITCLLLASRVGAGIAAEIGSMRVTEQIDALHLLSVDPIEYLVIPRWIGSVIAAVSLSLISVGLAVLAGATIAALKLHASMGEYFNSMFIFTQFSDLTGCVVKAMFFGTIIPIVASHYGFRCKYGSRGVGEAATSSVVHSSILIIISDFLLTYLFYAV